eukprot:TRINITY_DN5326_c0_g1_i4.p3 TRINITY_DN5326_c0_g1~~TRINITY_DN5326_c0_g1_i4.p3  ORF type:complete len:112 (-),score=20.24 TRINITY_DN5326_c0_g1_i4:742-1077(-)
MAEQAQRMALLEGEVTQHRQDRLDWEKQAQRESDKLKAWCEQKCEKVLCVATGGKDDYEDALAKLADSVRSLEQSTAKQYSAVQSRFGKIEHSLNTKADKCDHTCTDHGTG